MKQYNSQYEKMTEAPIGELVARLAVPTTISMMVTSIYNLVDTYFVGKLGNSASGAVGVVFSFMAVLQAFGFMFGQGAGSNISRKLGQKDSESASCFATTSFFLAFGLGIIFAILGYAFLEPLVNFLGSTETILPYACDYLRFLLWASPFVMCSFVLNNILRFEGKASLSMVGLLTGAIINIVADPIFIFVLDMGIAGAALATALSQTVSFFILLSMFIRGKTESKIAPKNFTHRLADVGNIIATGFPSLVRQGMGSAATIVLNHQAKVYGDAAVAAMSIVSRITMMIFSAGLGVGQGFQPVCGFNYGAKKYGRVKKAFFFTLKVSIIMMGTCAIIGLLLSNNLIGLFRDDEQVIEIGTMALRFQCCSLIIVPVQVLTNMLLQSTGKNLSASITSMLRSGLYFIPVLLILSYALGLLGIQMAQMVADIMSVLTCIPFLVYFFSHLPADSGEEAVSAT